MPTARVLIADDHAVVRAGLRQLLCDDAAVGEIGEAASGQQTLDRLRDGRWDLLILDIAMPDRNGLDILRHVRSGFPETRVLILSGFPESQYAINVLRAGAHGYLGKESAAEELLKAVHSVLVGRRYLSPTMAEYLISELDGANAGRPIHMQLSEREFQIFCKLAGGGSVSEIARELCLSVKTVSTYRSRVLEKMHFHTNADITSYALRNGLIQ
ncbi:MAG TPA: response regulator transcription factor [Steroidobacteraceae bacterium]|nr:response regulator transcription factor [Steroidobacteraceae bacterium]